MRKSIEVSLFSVEMGVARHNIQVPDTDKFCTVSYYSEKNNLLTSFTMVEFTGSEFGIALEGDKFLTVVNYVHRSVDAAEKIGSKNWSDSIWTDYIVPKMRNFYGGQVRKYKSTETK